MSSWWMVDHADDKIERDKVLTRLSNAAEPPPPARTSSPGPTSSSSRPTVYKRPATAGLAFAPFLAGGAQLEGCLDKLSSRRAWQKRYFELRGP